MKRDDHRTHKGDFDNVYYKTQDLEDIVNLDSLGQEAQAIIRQKMTHKQRIMEQVKDFKNSEIYGRLDMDLQELDEETAQNLKTSVWKKVFDFQQNTIYYQNSLTRKMFPTRPMGLTDQDEAQMEKIILGPDNSAPVLTNNWEVVEVNEEIASNQEDAEEIDGLVTIAPQKQNIELKTGFDPETGQIKYETSNFSFNLKICQRLIKIYQF